MAISDQLYANVSKQTSLADVDVGPPNGKALITWLVNVFHRMIKNIENDTFHLKRMQWKCKYLTAAVSGPSNFLMCVSQHLGAKISFTIRT